MDLEGFTRRRVIKGATEDQIVGELSQALSEFKDWDQGRRRQFSKAVYDEVVTTEGFRAIDDPFLKDIIDYPKADVSMGEFGVGSRGEGDFYVHRKIAGIIGDTGAEVDSRQQDDAGVVKAQGKYIITAVDGMHSRLSDFPFLAGFHAARAAMRDICVMGSRPVALISDMHLGDDGDVGKLFDFTAGVSAVGELTSTPLVAGSTLRIGGDMVLGDRFVSAVGAVGVSDSRPTARKNAEAGDVILVTEGSGGGTITTIALYWGRFDVLRQTLNVEFMEACRVLLEGGYMSKIHAMTDVTNGGLRGDAKEIAITAGKKLVFYEDMLDKPVNPVVREMLMDLEIDSLGISTDSLMLILPEDDAEIVAKALGKVTNVYRVGRVEEGAGAVVLGSDGEERGFKPMFREAAYTPVKKVIGDQDPESLKEMRDRIKKSALDAARKKQKVIDFIKED